MKVLVIGGGLIGVTTAYALSRRGVDVTVLERASAVGTEASFANGGLLTPSMSEPWNAPGCWRVLLASLGRSEAALQLRLGALPSLFAWGVAFLRNSNPAAFERSALANLMLALHSLQVMDAIRQETGLEYSRGSSGSLRLFRDVRNLDRAFATASRRAAHGLRCSKLSVAEVIEAEPALSPIADRLSGALYYADDETGDAHRFCSALADHMRTRGVDFHYHTEVTSFEMASGRLTAVLGQGWRFSADAFVVAAGHCSTSLLRRVGINLPVRPVKGYSITLPRPGIEHGLRIPIVDDDLHAAIVPIGSVIRVAGTAEFAGLDRTIRPGAIRNLERLLQQVLPNAGCDFKAMDSWCGLRPVSVDGVPIIGCTSISNLYVNSGHGHLGWTLAAGSAQLLTDLMHQAIPSVDPALVAMKRFHHPSGQ